jgi:hypothetical protein
MMPSGHGRLFEELEPPSGGLEGLRARIYRHTRRRRSFERLVYASAIVLLFVLTAAMIVGPRGLMPETRLPELEQARIRLGLSPTPDRALTLLGARRVSLQTDEVLLYMVSSVAPDPGEETRDQSSSSRQEM